MNDTKQYMKHSSVETAAGDLPDLKVLIFNSIFKMVINCRAKVE